MQIKSSSFSMQLFHPAIAGELKAHLFLGSLVYELSSHALFYAFVAQNQQSRIFFFEAQLLRQHSLPHHRFLFLIPIIPHHFQPYPQKLDNNGNCSNQNVTHDWPRGSTRVPRQVIVQHSLLPSSFDDLNPCEERSDQQHRRRRQGSSGATTRNHGLEHILCPAQDPPQL